MKKKETKLLPEVSTTKQTFLARTVPYTGLRGGMTTETSRKISSAVSLSLEKVNAIRQETQTTKSNNKKSTINDGELGLSIKNGRFQHPKRVELVAREINRVDHSHDIFARQPENLLV